MAEREARQAAMRSAAEAASEPSPPLTVAVKEAAKMLHVSLSTVYNMAREDTDGVHRILTRSTNKKPIIRIEYRWIERILRRSSAA
jgi:hypothetical protein